MSVITRKFKFSFLSLLVLFAFTFVSCEQEEVTVVDVDNLVDGSIEDLQTRAVGKNHCLEFVFPISIEFIDGTSAEVTDYVSLHETIKTFFEDNDLEKSKENKPSLVFPLEVVSQDGAIVQVSSEDELKELRSECPRTGKGKRGSKGRGHKCFALEFPISAVIDGETLSFEDKQSLKTAIKAYKQEVGDDAERPELVFPITVIYDDGTSATVTSQEELKALKDACKEM